MRTENGSNETLKATTAKSSFQNINLDNQLFNVGQGDQSFDQIFTQQSAGRTPSAGSQRHNESSSASKKASTPAESGNSLPADRHQQRLEKHQATKQAQAERQQQAALQDRQQKKLDSESRKDARAAEKAEQTADQTARTAGHKDDTEVATEAVTAESEAEQPAAPGEASSLAGNTEGTGSDSSSETDTGTKVGVEANADAQATANTESEKAGISAVEEANESTEMEVANELSESGHDSHVDADGDRWVDTELLVQQDLASKDSDTGVEGGADSKTADAAALIEEVLANPAQESQPATQAASTEKASQAATVNLTMNGNASPQKTDTANTIAQNNPDIAGADLFSEASEKITDALEASKSDTVKKAATNNEGTLLSPVQERLAALAKSLEKPAKEGASPFQRKASEAVDATKGSTFQRSVDQLSRLQTNAVKPLATSIPMPMNQKEWAGEMGQKLMMMVSSKIQSAQIQVSPGDMGPIDVKVSMQKDQAHVVFTSQVAQTRDVLEQALPKLREMLDQNGIEMGNADVRDQGTHQSGQRQDRQQQGRSEHQESVAAADTGVERVSVQQVGIVDYYA
ncbi:MAG: flagellar hook-length control protein FliK [Ketobacter sp.]